MITPSSHRLRHQLPAYVAGTLPARRRAGIEAGLAHDPVLRAECDRLAALAAVMLAHDPASPPDPAAAELLKQRLHAELNRGGVRPLLGWQPRLAAGAAAALLFAVGLLTGASLFPREVVREVVKERPVAVAVPVPRVRPVVVERIVERRVEVPVERVVTRWRTRTVTRTVVVKQGAAATPRPSMAQATTPRATREVVELPVDAGLPSPVSVAVAPPTARAGAVDF